MQILQNCYIALTIISYFAFYVYTIFMEYYET